MKIKEKKEKLDQFMKIEDSLSKDWDKAYNQSSFYGMQYVFLDMIIGLILTVGVIFLSAFVFHNGYVSCAIGFIFFFWVNGENIFNLKGNKYSFYNWKTGGLNRDKKLNEMKKIVEELKNE